MSMDLIVAVLSEISRNTPPHQALSQKRGFAMFQSRRNYNGTMRKVGMDFESVRRIGTALPGVVESTAYGMPALKVRGKLLASVPANRSVEPNSLVVCVSAEQRDELLATSPDVFYLTEHYEGYDNVLVRLPKIDVDVLKGLLRMALTYRTSASRRVPR